MSPYILRRETWIGRPLDEVFDFFSRAENLERITPPWIGFRIVTPGRVEMKAGARLEYKIRLHGISLGWITEIERWEPPFFFVDVQLKGPYKLWRHTHAFAERDGGTAMTDTVEYALPFGIVGRIVNRLQVARDLERIFDYRADRIREILG
jgi:ligand-binding SRPBCC domain-containing protein